MAIQGFGNVGSHAAKMMQRIGIQNRRRSATSAEATITPNGIDIPAALRYALKNGSLKGLPRSRLDFQ